MAILGYTRLFFLKANKHNSGTVKKAQASLHIWHTHKRSSNCCLGYPYAADQGNLSGTISPATITMGSDLAAAAVIIRFLRTAETLPEILRGGNLRWLCSNQKGGMQRRKIVISNEAKNEMLYVNKKEER